MTSPHSVPRSALFRAALTLVAAGALGIPAVASAETLTLADTGTTASRVTADMQATMLRRLGHTVTRVSLGSAGAAADRLTARTIDAYVADSAAIVDQAYRSGPRPNDADMKTFIGSRSTARGATAFGYSAADDHPAVACRARTVITYRITGLLRLPAVAPSLRYGATPSHMVRADGYWALRSTFKSVVVRSGTGRFRLIGLKRLECVQSTVAEPRAARLRLRTLRDARRRLASTPRRTVTVAADGPLGAVPEWRTIADQIAGKVTVAALIRLRGAIEIDGRSPAVVGDEFLRSTGVLPAA